MADVCCDALPESDCASSTRKARRRRRMEIRACKAAEDAVVAGGKRRRVEGPAAEDGKGKKVLGGGCGEEAAAALSVSEGQEWFGVMSFIGRRRDMEDAVSVRPSFAPQLDFFAVFDGHGCSHVKDCD